MGTAWDEVVDEGLVVAAGAQVVQLQDDVGAWAN